MKQAECADYVHVSIDRCRIVSWSKEVHDYKWALVFALVTEKLVTKIEKYLLVIYSIEVWGIRCSVKNQFSKVLAKAAARVEKFLSGLETRENLRVAGMLGEVEVKKPKLLNAWIWFRL